MEEVMARVETHLRLHRLQREMSRHNQRLEEINLELQDILHCFRKGHRIMVQIQSTWFPLADLNPQKYVENIYLAKPEDLSLTAGIP
jgi:predicted acyl esterase